MKWKIPLFKSYWEEDDINSIAKVIRRGTYWATGPEINKFEEKISDFIGLKYALVFNSGTSALYANFIANGVKSGEVIVPSFTFIATANSVFLVGAKPVFAEIEDETYGLDAEDVEKKITNKTKAIMPIHYGGLACRDINKIRDIAKKNDLLLIEDAAQSFGSRIKEEMVGSFGSSAMFSFCQNKVITTGEGGVVVTNSKDVYEKLKLIRSHGRVEEKQGDYFSTTDKMDYSQIGYNFRMPTMVAALGLSQIKKINKTVKMRRENAHYMSKKLSDVNQIKTPVEPKNHYHVYQMYTIQLENQKQRDDLQKYLSKKRIMTKVYFDPIHLKSFYKKEFGYKKGILPKTEDSSRKVLTLPMYPSLEKPELDLIAESIKEFFEV